jgi:hypothetical protein
VNLCAHCGGSFNRPHPTGRKPRFCGAKCCNLAYWYRHRERLRPLQRATAKKNRAVGKWRVTRGRSSPTQERARRLLRDAVRRGRIIKPSSCERCGNAVERRLLHGHHRDLQQAP